MLVSRAQKAYLGNCVLDDLFARQIRLVAYQQLVDSFGSISINFLEPLLNVCERVLGRYDVSDMRIHRANPCHRRSVMGITYHCP